MPLYIAFTIFTALLGGTSFIFEERPNLLFREITVGNIEEEEPKELPAIFLTGDIMLGRAVERRMLAMGYEYPFLGTSSLWGEDDVVIGNFEGVIPRVHQPTPDFGFQFSMRPEFLTEMVTAGFDVISLANNHSNDHGEEARMHTRGLCLASGIACVGEYSSINKYSTLVYPAGGTEVGIIALNAVFHSVDKESLQESLKTLEESSDIQIAYVHWGIEYEEVHDESQQALAEMLIDLGVDAVVGHHPHVVQDIGIYKGKPILYSLGNFIFDQYFSTEVQQGLVVKITGLDGALQYELIPVTSAYSKNQPHPLEGEEKDAFIEELLLRNPDTARQFDGAFFHVL